MMSLHSSKQQGDIALKAHVASICFKCFRCFRGVLQVFHINIAKVDQDVAHVAMTIHVCFKCRFQMFHLFQIYVVSVSFGRCKSRFGCCIYMQVFRMFSYVCCKCFHLDVCNGCTRGFKFFLMFLQVFQTNVANVSTVSNVCWKYSI
jgi:hypothetical protein